MLFKVKSIALVVALAHATVSCASHKVYNPEPLRQAPGQAKAVVLVNEEHKVSPGGLQEALVDAVKGSGMAEAVAAEAAVENSGPPSGRSFMLTFQVDRYDVTPIKRLGGDPTAAVLVYSVGVLLIIPAMFIGLVREKTEQELEFTVALQDLSGAPLKQKETPVGPKYVYDVSSVPPVFRKSYTVELDEGRNWIRSEIGSHPSLAEHRDEIARQYAHRMVNAAAPDIIEALRRLPARPPEPAPSEAASLTQ